MARSDYVYVVTSPGQVAPFAAFTVKRELKVLLERIEREAPSVLAHLRFFRMDDGEGGMVSELTADGILNDRRE